LIGGVLAAVAVAGGLVVALLLIRDGGDGVTSAPQSSVPAITFPPSTPPVATLPPPTLPELSLPSLPDLSLPELPDLTFPEFTVPDFTLPDLIPPPTEQPDGLGTDPELDELAEECYDGEMRSCDDLYQRSPTDSAYETYGDTCAGRQPEHTRRYCTDVFGG
jgi:hypothetical protein